MNLKFNNKRITGILTILPENEVSFDEEISNYNFSRGQSMKLKLIMGYDKRRIVPESTTCSDLCIFGMDFLLNKGLLNKNDIDALILVTQSPDHFMPPTSNIIQGKLDLKSDMICMDINQGCAGYIIGLSQAFMLLEQDEIHKVILLNAEVLSRKVSQKDRNNRPIIGDGASITIIEKDPDSPTIYGTISNDGKGADVLTIPAGAFKLPSTTETAALKEDKSGNSRALDHPVMKGDEVFNFVQKEVPPMIDNLFEIAGCNKDDIDYFMFHQPNKFMLKKLADKMEIPYEKMPNNIVENFGNASGVTIPTTISYNIGNRLLEDSLLVCMAGFGTGLAWASLLIVIEKLTFCEIINYS